jgi:hypothetical protein
VVRVGWLDDLAEELEPRGVGVREVARHGCGYGAGGGGGGGARWVGRGRRPAPGFIHGERSMSRARRWRWSSLLPRSLTLLHAPDFFA